MFPPTEIFVSTDIEMLSLGLATTLVRLSPSHDLYSLPPGLRVNMQIILSHQDPTFGRWTTSRESVSEHVGAYGCAGRPLVEQVEGRGKGVGDLTRLRRS